MELSHRSFTASSKIVLSLEDISPGTGLQTAQPCESVPSGVSDEIDSAYTSAVSYKHIM